VNQPRPAARGARASFIPTTPIVQAGADHAGVTIRVKNLSDSLTVHRHGSGVGSAILESAMALKVELKPGERIILGECVVTNHDQRTRLVIEGHVPILREKDILTVEHADSPAKRIYLAVQLMYTSRDPRMHHEVYFTLVRDILKAAPSVWPYIESINNHILTGEMYKALKDAKKLIAYEQELLSNAKRGAGLRFGSEADRKSA
jgi:flagellar biosynthesis repressor protein FlbT